MKMTATPSARKLTHHVEQNRDLAFVERGGRLVHDHELRLERNRAGDRDHLLDRGREFHQRPAHVDLDREAPQQVGRLAFMRPQSSRPKRRYSRPRKMFSATER